MTEIHSLISQEWENPAWYILKVQVVTRNVFPSRNQQRGLFMGVWGRFIAI